MKQSLMILVTVSRSDRHIFLSENNSTKTNLQNQSLASWISKKKKIPEKKIRGPYLSVHITVQMLNLCLKEYKINPEILATII